MQTFEEWFDKNVDESMKEYESIYREGWRAATEAATRELADNGSQHYDSEEGSYIDSWESIDN